MKSKFLAWVSALAAVALVSGVLVVTANAKIGASSAPFDSDGPDLQTATVTGDDEVKACFDEEVADVGTPADYILHGYDSAQFIVGDDADLASEEDCVDVTFNPPSEKTVHNYTVFVVLDDSVEDRGGDTAPQGIVDLDGSTAPGEGNSPISTGPDLREWTTHAGDDSISYFFDENLDCVDLLDGTASDDVNAEHFGFYMEDEDVATDDTTNNSNREVVIGDDVLSGEDNVVEIQFDDNDAADFTQTDHNRFAGDDAPEDGVNEGSVDVEDAEKVFVTSEPDDDFGGFDGAQDVGDPDEVTGNGSPDDGGIDGQSATASEAQSSPEDIDNTPDLTDVERIDETEFAFTFDEDLSDDPADVDGTEFFLVLDDGQEGASDDDCDVDGNVVECDFDDDMVDDNLDDVEDDELAYAGVMDCAVVSDETNANDRACNTYGSFETSSGEAPGWTDAPDLIDCDVDDDADIVTYTYDEDIDDDDNDPTGANYYVFDVEGDQTNGDTGNDDVDGNTVSIEYEDEDLAEMIGCGFDGTANDTEDEMGNDALPATVGFEPASSAPPSTSTSTTTATVTTTSPTGHTPKTVRVNTTITIRYDGKPAKTAAFKGSISARFEKCTTGRLVTLKKKGAGSVGTDSSNKKGNWKIRERNANGKYHAEVAKKVYTARNGDTIVCRKDASVTINV